MDNDSKSRDADIEYISKEGFEKLQSELERLKTTQRLGIAERLEYAKSLGDLSENAEFDAAKEDQMLNEMRIRELEDVLSRASIIAKRESPVAVSIGSTITVGIAGSEECYTIVGSSEEIDPMNGRISYESPLGRAFLGRKKGEVVIVPTLKGSVEYVIINVA